MSTETIDAEVLDRLRRIVAAGVQSPSAGNWHPWFFRRSGMDIQIFFEPKRVTMPFDAHNLASVFALGMVLESMIIAASAEGFDSECTLEPDGWQTSSDARVHCATVKLSPGQVTPDPLAAFIYARVTDRRPTVGGSIDDAVFSQIRRAAEAFPRARLHLATSASDGVVRFAQRMDFAVRKARTFFEYIIRPMRLTDRSAYRTRDGVSWRNFGIGRIAALVTAIGRALPFGLVSRMAKEPRPGLPSPLRSATVLGCVTVTGLDTASLVEAGRLCMRNWLQLTRAGYVMRPHFGAPFLAYMNRRGVLVADVAAAMGDGIERGVESMHESFSYPDGETPIWLFATGKPASTFPSIARTLRRRVEDTYVE